MSGRYLKVFFTKTQDGGTTMMTIAELQVYDATGIIWGNGSQTGQGGGDGLANNVPQNKTAAFIAGEVSDGNNGDVAVWKTTAAYLILDFGSTKTPTKFRYLTTHSAYGGYAKAPIRWLLEISSDNTSFTTLHEQGSDETIVSTNQVWAADGTAIGTEEDDSFFSIASGGGGDPYITTIKGQFYKMDNFTGFFRLVQGELENKQLTINGYCQLDNKSEEDECNETISNLLLQKNIDILEKYENIKSGAMVYQTTDLTNQSFIHLFYVRYGDEELIVKIYPRLEIILNNSSYSIDYNNSNKKGLGVIPMYSNMNSDNSWLITINKLVINLSTYKNPQIRNGFSLINFNSIKNANGILVNTLDKKHSEIDSLYSLEPVHNEDIPFKTQNCEFFLNTDDINSVQKNYAIKGFQTGIPIEHDVSLIATVL
jgi:hypothetical protein